LDVKIIGIGTGFSYGTLGMTHHGTEDLAVMSVLPNMTIITPCDPVEMELAIKASVAWNGPCYIRVRRTGEPVIHRTIPDFKIGKGIVVKDGDDVTLIATGWIINNIIKAAKMLESENINARIISMHTVKPLDEALILDSARKTRGIITIEDQSIVGLGSAVARTLASSEERTVPFAALGLTENYSIDVGSEEYHLNKSNLSPEAICKTAKRILTVK
jgi:transketolase